MASNSILVYSRTAGYRHESIPTAKQVISTMGFKADFSEDPSSFDSQSNLAQYAALVFLSNSDEILDTPQQKTNLENYLTNGGGLVGIHAGSAALFNTPFFGTAMGAFFDYHPTIQQATFEVLNANHPSTSPVPSRWTFEEEVYNFRSDPRKAGVQVLMSVDYDSYDDPNKDAANAKQGTPHPIAWYRDSPVDLGAGTGTNGMLASNGSTVAYGTFTMTGRLWYTALGHTDETWQDSTFQAHIKGGISWVLAGKSTASTSSSSSSTARSSTSASITSSSSSSSSASKTSSSASSSATRAPTSATTSQASQTSTTSHATLRTHRLSQLTLLSIAIVPVLIQVFSQ